MTATIGTEQPDAHVPGTVDPVDPQVGVSARRVGGRERVTGRQRFVGDIRLDDVLHVKRVTLDCARARIVAIDTSAAERVPGVRAVLTGADLPDPMPRFGPVQADRPVLAVEADGMDVTTIEGLGAGGGLSRLQDAFLETGAIQCGFCIPGMVVSAEALLAENPRPTAAEVREGLAGNLCRCAGYQRIVDAVLRAAEAPA